MSIALNTKVMIVAVAFAMLFFVSTIANAQTTTPGAPNTGAGGSGMQNMLLLAGAALVALAGTAFLLRGHSKTE